MSRVRSHISPGPYRSFRELSLAGSVDPVTWCPPTFVGNSGIERSNGHRGFALLLSCRCVISWVVHNAGCPFCRTTIEGDLRPPLAEARRMSDKKRAPRQGCSQRGLPIEITSALVSVTRRSAPKSIRRPVAGARAGRRWRCGRDGARHVAGVSGRSPDDRELGRSASRSVSRRGELIPDIMLVPLAAFDRLGHRIGYGAGHYDYTLAHLRKMKAITAIGLAFAAQEIEAVPALSHDVPLDYVLTEAEMFDFRSS